MIIISISIEINKNENNLQVGVYGQGVQVIPYNFDLAAVDTQVESVQIFKWEKSKRLQDS